MILQLTEDEVTRILDALDTYSCAKNLKFQESGGHDEEARPDRDWETPSSKIPWGA